jgi:hemerythrin-like domain-containing protein
MTDRLERGIHTDRHDVNALLIFLHYFGDVLHQSKEESILLPALKSSDKCPEDFKSLLGEHVQQRGLIEKTQFLLFTDLQDEFVASARKLIGLLSKHADEEEHVLFPLAERILTIAKAEEVRAKLEYSDAEFGERQLRLLMDMLHQLEDKYIPKAA